MIALSKQVAAFEEQIGDIRAQYGSVWAVFMDGEVKSVFPTFDQAADYAFDRFDDDNFLIRHTYQQPEFAPLILVEP